MAVKIPIIDVSAQNQAIEEEILRSLTQVIRSGAFILGPEVKALEEEFSHKLKLKNSISCASGSDALLLPLMAEGIGPGDEVLVPSFTFYATAAAVARLGATPIFVDTDDSYNMDLEDVAKKISSRTKAIIPVHLFGLMTDMIGLKNLVVDNSPPKGRIAIVEDCAQSIGAMQSGIPCGSWGDYGAFSFYPTKNLGAMGDAGMITAASDQDAHKLKMLRVHGSEKRYYHEFLGVNSRLDSFQAAVLRVKLRKLSEYEEKRAHAAATYFSLFEQAGLQSEVALPKTFSDRKHVWNQFTVRAQRRDELKAYLAEAGIGSEVYYPLGLHRQKAFAAFIEGPLELNHTERLEKEVLSLPMYPEIPAVHQEIVVASIKKFYTKM